MTQLESLLECLRSLRESNSVLESEKRVLEEQKVEADAKIKGLQDFLVELEAVKSTLAAGASRRPSLAISLESSTLQGATPPESTSPVHVSSSSSSPTSSHQSESRVCEGLSSKDQVERLLHRVIELEDHQAVLEGNLEDVTTQKNAADVLIQQLQSDLSSLHSTAAEMQAIQLCLQEASIPLLGSPVATEVCLR